MLKDSIKYIFITLSTIILLFGLGYIQDGDWTSTSFAFLTFFLSYIFAFHNKYTLTALVIIYSLLSLYFPTGIIYGSPNTTILVTLLNTQEFDIALGYIKSIKLEIVVTIIFVILQIIFLTCFKPEKKINFKYITLFIGSLFVSLYGFSIQEYEINHNAFIRMVKHSYHSFQHTKKEQASIHQSQILDVELTKIDNPEKIKIIIVGESVRSDYMSVYGYPYPTTPFLTESNGIFLDGYIANSPNTAESLNRTLFKTDITNNTIDWQFNVISLANAAGYNTYWISNQGQQGYGDDIIFQMAGLAKERHFLRKAEYHLDEFSDFDMLPIFNSIIENKDINNKLIFIHMIGSHEPVCTRILSDKLNFTISSDVDCYIASIEKLDHFIKSIVSKLQLENLDYELLYFSDHGLAVSKNGAYHATDIHEAFTVPLFLLSNDISNQTIIKKQISALHFLDFYAQLLNIKQNDLNPTYNLYNLLNIPPDNDPIVYWREYKNLSSISKRQKAELPNTNQEKTYAISKKRYSSKCLTNLDYVSYMEDKFTLAVNGWIATENTFLPLEVPIGAAYGDKNNNEFYPLHRAMRQDVGMHFNLKETNEDFYGFTGLINTNNLPKKSDLYLSYIDTNNEAVICLNTPIITSQHKPMKLDLFEISDQCIGNIEEIYHNDTNLKIKGWIAQKENNLPIEERLGITYKIGNQTYFYEVNKNLREDVAKHLGFADLDNQLYGFESTHDIPENSTDFHLSYMNGNIAKMCRNPALSIKY